jgi:hypothetical protein
MPGPDAFLSPADLRMPAATVVTVGLVVLVPLLAILAWLVLDVV